MLRKFKKLNVLIACLIFVFVFGVVGCAFGSKQNGGEDQSYTATYYIAKKYYKGTYYEYQEYYKILNVKTVDDLDFPNPQQRPSNAIPGKVRSDGYTFKGWSLDEINIFDPSDDFEITDNLKFYAVYDLNQYNIEYVLDEGVNNSQNVSTYTVEDGEITLFEPAKTGYDFVGWYFELDKENTKVTAVDSNITSDLTLYAKWSVAEYEINYNFINYNYVKVNSEDEFVHRYTMFSDDIILPEIRDALADEEDSSYSFFDGWYSKDGRESGDWGDKIEKIEKGSTGNIRVYAKWHQKDE